MRIGSIALIPNDGVFYALNCSKGRGIILPGGKWEEGETFSQTAVRETKEELGITVVAGSFLYCGPSPDGYMVHTFLCRRTNFDEKVNVSSEGIPVWATWEMLLRSKFKGYYEIIRDIYLKDYADS